MPPLSSLIPEFAKNWVRATWVVKYLRLAHPNWRCQHKHSSLLEFQCYYQSQDDGLSPAQSLCFCVPLLESYLLGVLSVESKGVTSRNQLQAQQSKLPYLEQSSVAKQRLAFPWTLQSCTTNGLILTVIILTIAQFFNYPFQLFPEDRGCYGGQPINCKSTAAI